MLVANTVRRYFFMQKREKTKKLIARIVFDAMMIAIYVVLARFLVIPTPIVEISIISLPILLCAKLFGIGDVLVIATIGSFLEQAVSPYGLMPTTPLWMMPIILMGAFAGVACHLTRNSEKKLWTYVIIIISELILTFGNTVVLMLTGYVVFEMSFKWLIGLAVPRLINSGFRMLISCILLPTLVPPLKKILK